MTHKKKGFNFGCIIFRLEFNHQLKKNESKKRCRQRLFADNYITTSTKWCAFSGKQHANETTYQA